MTTQCQPHLNESQQHFLYFLSFLLTLNVMINSKQQLFLMIVQKCVQIFWIYLKIERKRKKNESYKSIWHVLISSASKYAESSAGNSNKTASVHLHWISIPHIILWIHNFNYSIHIFFLVCVVDVQQCAMISIS